VGEFILSQSVGWRRSAAKPYLTGCLCLAAPSTPDAFGYLHMGMLSALPNGSIAAVFQASPDFYEGGALQNLFWTSSRDGVTWSPPSLLIKVNGLPVWSPVMHTEGGRVWLLYTRSKSMCEYQDRHRNVTRFSPGGDIMVVSSDDSGLSWSPPQMVLSYETEGGIPKVLANKLTVLSSGSWVLPFWREPGKTCPQREAIKDPVTDKTHMV
jgi:hypothetical protein